ncbi:hypothetical protein HRbin28_00850 [bacterium HR28]|nr:hypothetical protein HRbin28_00850 [bacterium HR28]
MLPRGTQHPRQRARLRVTDLRPAPTREARYRSFLRTGRSSGLRIVLLAAPSQRIFRQWLLGRNDRVQRSSPLTAAGQRRICTGLPGTRPGLQRPQDVASLLNRTATSRGHTHSVRAGGMPDKMFQKDPLCLIGSAVPRPSAQVHACALWHNRPLAQ